MEHVDMKINQVVVMYLNDDQVSRVRVMDLDPTPLQQISWYQVVRVPSIPFVQETILL
jgi:hypothetical protein